MRQSEIVAVRTLAERLLTTNLKRGRDRTTGFDYSYICPSPHEYGWQWLWDSCFNAIAMAHVSPEHAQAELRTLVAGQDASGFIGHITYWGSQLWGIPHLLSYGQAPPSERLRRSGLIQPPVLAQAVERVAEVTHDAAFAPQLMPALDLHHNWLAHHRAPDPDGLLVILSPYESGTDHSPVYDAAMGLKGKAGRLSLGARDRWLDVRNWLNGYDSGRMMRSAHFYVKDALVNALYADSLATMGRLHRAQGDTEAASAYAEQADTVTTSMLAKMLDRGRGAFFSLMGKVERRAQPLTVGCLVPLVLQGLPDEIAGDMVERHVSQRDEFWLRYPVPSVAATEPTFDPRGSSLSWRGPTWLNTNWILWRGLRRHGFDELAEELATRTATMVARAGLWEFYNPLSGQGMGARSFAGSALALDMASG